MKSIFAPAGKQVGKVGGYAQTFTTWMQGVTMACILPGSTSALATNNPARICLQSWQWRDFGFRLRRVARSFLNLNSFIEWLFMVVGCVRHDPQKMMTSLLPPSLGIIVTAS